MDKYDVNSLQNIEVEDEGVEYVMIQTGNELYGIDIAYVDNIVRYQKITRIPKAQRFFKGVINLRGEIISVMSFRLKLGLSEIKETKSTRIIIVKPEAETQVGIVVDEIKEVINLKANDIDKGESSDSSDAKNSYVDGIGKYGDKLISLINIKNLIVERGTSNS